MAETKKKKKKKSETALIVPKITSIGDDLFFGLRETMTEKQMEMVNMILTHDITLCNSPSGTGKTLLSFATGEYLRQHGVVKKIVYLFNPTEEGEMGFREGGQAKKEEAYLDPIIDAMTKLKIPSEKLNVFNGNYIAKSHTFLRGVNLEDSFIIMDELQNWKKKDIKKTLTRAHLSNSKIVGLGCDKQIDLKFPSDSAFIPLIMHMSQEPQKRCAIADLGTHSFRGWLAEYIDQW